MSDSSHVSTFVLANTAAHAITGAGEVGAAEGHEAVSKTLSTGSDGGASARGIMSHSASFAVDRIRTGAAAGGGCLSHPSDGVRALFQHFALPHLPPLLLHSLSHSSAGATYDAHSTAARSDDRSQQQHLQEIESGISPSKLSARPARRRIPSPQDGSPLLPVSAARYPSPPSAAAASASTASSSTPPVAIAQLHRLSSEMPTIVYENCPECECTELEAERIRLESPPLPQYPNKISRTQSPHTQYTKAATLWSLPPPEPFTGSRTSTLARNAPAHASLLMLNAG